jgi:UDP-N-acetyl-D-mannosaminuronic acid transferase (WecB/TagA/CpsF family)
MAGGRYKNNNKKEEIDMSLVKHRFRVRDGSLTESKDWYARFTYKGKAHYFSTRTPNKTLAAKIESKKLQELIEQAELGLLKSVSIKVALDKYIQSMSHSKENNNIRNPGGRPTSSTCVRGKLLHPDAVNQRRSVLS